MYLFKISQIEAELKAYKSGDKFDITKERLAKLPLSYILSSLNKSIDPYYLFDTISKYFGSAYFKPVIDKKHGSVDMKLKKEMRLKDGKQWDVIIEEKYE
jgi:hypothetical protein